ncbi:aspartate carbamoyltransferase [bacterium]|nr:aspartate carbamoyltransferase [bacterium]
MNNKLSFKNLLTTQQLTHQDISLLINTAIDLKNTPLTNINAITPFPILASLFFEPSTRTRFSFESAILRLGGNYINLEQANTSSIAKGESLEDMGRVMSDYADIIVLRHPDINSMKAFSQHTTVPVINAGNGSEEHPTQALIDLMTLYEHHQRLDSLTIGFWGDLKYSRTVNSLTKTLASYSNNTFHFIATDDFQVSATCETMLTQQTCNYVKTSSLNDCLEKLDILYVTRTQTERFTKTLSEYLSPLNKDLLQNIPKNCIILHPLPRVNEMSNDIDTLANAHYFKQSQNGLYMRMALIKTLLQNE